MNSNITSLKEQSIKHRTGSEILIGSYGEDSNTGQAYFSDIRGEDGAVVDRTLIEKDVRISYDGPKLEIDTFYQFHWHMDANGDIVIDGKVEKIDRVRFLNKLFDVYATMQGKALTDAANNQNTILKEVTGAEHTYIYELLQNANDYPYPGEEDDVKVKFIVTDHYLFFLHTARILTCEISKEYVLSMKERNEIMLKLSAIRVLDSKPYSLKTIMCIFTRETGTSDLTKNILR